jgi:NitT/TauT family transport system substrate-binding protein
MCAPLQSVLATLLLFGAGCARPEPAQPAAGVVAPALRPIVLQTDWLPQAEHGGFYQALARGFYAEAGLAVELLPGGVNAQVNLRVARGDADFGLNRSDLLFAAQDQGLPVVVIAAHLQHDPQALLVHADSPVKGFADLDGRTVIAAPSMIWIPYLKKRYGVEFSLRPVTYGLAGFIADPTAIQQGFVTNEPYYAERNGVKVRALLIADSGYDAYHVLFSRRELARSDPALVAAFTAASLRGWQDYLEGDPAPAHAEILRRNPQASPDHLAYSRDQMRARQLVTGDTAAGDALGRIRVTRVLRQLEALREAGLVSERATPEQFVLPQALTDDRAGR